MARSGLSGSCVQKPYHLGDSPTVRRLTRGCVRRADALSAGRRSLMAEEIFGSSTQREPDVKEVHVIWITAGLGCDGDSVSITAATQPSVEDVLLGAIPGLPKVHLHNPVLAYENGDEFMKFWYEADAGRLDPFVLVIEGSIPNESIKSEGYWCGFGNDPATGQPMTTSEWLRPLAPQRP